MDAAKPDERLVAGFDTMHRQWWAQATQRRDKAPIAAARNLGGEQSLSDRSDLLYNRGPLVLHMMRTMLGRARFDAVIRAFLDRSNMGYATTDGFAKAASDVLKTDFRWFVDQ